tara:strand:+ start:574 stop:1194 length:621 start_codon:yes stop_codon:yes gene_type:complete
MKKNTPLTSLSNNRSFIDEVNWEEIENNLSVKTYLFIRDIIFFAHSDSVMKECFRLLDSENLIFKTYDNFNTALRVGIANTADIIVLVDDFASASNANFTKLIQTRSSHDLHVITWNNSSIKELVLSIKNALASINQIETKELIVEKIISTRSSANQSEQNEFVTDESMLSERDLRKLLVKELDDNRNLEPEKILAKAIQVIKELK